MLPFVVKTSTRALQIACFSNNPWGFEDQSGMEFKHIYSRVWICKHIHITRGCNYSPMTSDGTLHKQQVKWGHEWVIYATGNHGCGYVIPLSARGIFAFLSHFQIMLAKYRRILLSQQSEISRASSWYKDDISRYGFSIINIRQSPDRRIVIIRIPILVRQHIFFETATDLLSFHKVEKKDPMYTGIRKSLVIKSN